MENKNMYLTVTVDFVPTGMNLTMWMSPEEFWMSEQVHFPHTHLYWGDKCKWTMHSNMELTAKIIATIAEQAERICDEQQRANDRRKPVNR